MMMRWRNVIWWLLLLLRMLGTSFPVVAAAPDVLQTHDDVQRYYFGSVTLEWNTLGDVLVNNEIQLKIRRNIISHFCDAVLHKKDLVWQKNLGYTYFIPDNVLYEPRQSYFVYTLCVNLDEKSQWLEFSSEPYIYRNYKDVFTNVSYDHSTDVISLADYIKEDIELNTIWWIPQQSSLDALTAYSPCNPKTSMQACNFSRFLPDIFMKIMNDITNLKLAAQYGYNYFADEDDPATTEEKEARALKEFADSYFNEYSDPLAPCNDPQYHYLYPDALEWDRAHCSHPKTAEYLLNIIRWTRRLVKKTVLLDANKIFPEECGQVNAMLAQAAANAMAWWTTPINDPMIWNITSCAFSSYGSIFLKTDMKAFYNLYLNELMRYSLFLDYYSNQILSDPAYSPLTFGSVSNVSRQNQKEAVTINYELAIAQQAAQQTIRMLSNIYTTFPIHIGLHAYWEDIVNYRQQLTKMYTPLHQLYYTLRNVQSCQE